MNRFGASKVSQGQPSVKELTTMIEKYFERRNLQAQKHQLNSAEGLGWWLTEGSAKIYIFVVEDHRGSAIRITSPTNRVPNEDRAKFYHYLLEVNRDLSGVSIAIFKDVVMVSGQRSTIGLDQEELNDIVWSVSYVADKLDNELLDKFNAPLYKEAG